MCALWDALAIGTEDLLEAIYYNKLQLELQVNFFIVSTIPDKCLFKLDPTKIQPISYRVVQRAGTNTKI